MFEALRKLFRRDIQDHPNAISADDARRINTEYELELFKAYLEHESGYLDIIFDRIKQTAKNGGRNIIVYNIKHILIQLQLSFQALILTILLLGYHLILRSVDITSRHMT